MIQILIQSIKKTVLGISSKNQKAVNFFVVYFFHLENKEQRQKLLYIIN